MHFDTIDAGNTATNTGNAIRYIATTYNNIGYLAPLPAAVNAATTNAMINWSRPADLNRIIGGFYQVTFTVSATVQSGRVEATIGGQVAWVWENGVGTIYNASPLTFEQNEDTDQIPVSLSATGAGDATITITNATRSVVTGNRDEANYALVAPGQVLKVSQVDTVPDYGRIRQAWLAVRWFATTAGLGTTAVSLGGQALGPLKQTQLGTSTLSQTVSTSITSQGQANIPAQGLSISAVAGGTGTLSSTVAVVRQTLSPVYQAIVGSVPVVDAAVMLRIKPPANVIAGSHTVTFTSSHNTTASYNNSVLIYDGAGTLAQILGGSGSSRSVSMTADNTQYSTTITTTANQSTECTIGHNLSVFVEDASGKMDTIGRFRKMMYLTIDWTVTPTSRNDTAASGGAVTANGFSSPTTPANSGITASTSGGSISFTVPAPPRVVDTWFPLPYTQWADFQTKQLLISLTGGTPNLAIVEASLFCDFDAETLSAPGQITAPLTGPSGNPADVLTTLAAASGQRLEPRATAQLRSWCTANAYTFARRLQAQTDALTLLTFAAEQAGVILAARDEAIAPVRWFDLASDVTVINESDCLSPASIGWADRLDNPITLNYQEETSQNPRSPSVAEGGTGQSGYNRALVANSSNNTHCRQGLAATLLDTPATLDAGWIRSDTVAATYLAATAKRTARPRRILTLDLPHTYSYLQAGDLINFTRLSEGPADTITARITHASSDAGWPQITAEQILD
jgi:hypothetical protein